MTDREIIEGLIGRNKQITEKFFYVKCRPLLTAIMRQVFTCPVEYDEMVAELYDFLMETLKGNIPTSSPILSSTTARKNMTASWR